MTVRQNAEALKQALGTTLGVYESFKDIPNPTAAITEFLNAMPQSILNQFSGLFATTADIAAAVIPLGTVLAKYFPAA